VRKGAENVLDDGTPTPYERLEREVSDLRERLETAERQVAFRVVEPTCQTCGHHFDWFEPRKCPGGVSSETRCNVAGQHGAGGFIAIVQVLRDQQTRLQASGREAADLRERGAKLATALRAQEWGGGHFGEGCWCAGGCPDYCVQARAALSSWDGPEKAE
jgi:hypothetical protein